jgi:hypothetical protein
VNADSQFGESEDGMARRVGAVREALDDLGGGTQVAPSSTS